ncbi:WD40 repeat protein [Mucilaginibacter gracilis]|uniref:WD40 repeat protein n=1 Tax=Mucilaginibacter gracilis TaxID=423350 RepID=A0A495J3G9_9SPHI|nr:DPP IV N-terminal domain-containing protein [Mucilaginibacter gracilis]RKR83152.1 WD40 repeat protein [Mucilaginibacter gracilis]
MNKRYSFPRILLTVFLFLFLLAGLFLTPGTALAQGFGQNKVRYKNLDFKVYKTPHFEIYYYIKNDSLIKRFAQESELWYTLHQQVFRDTFKKPNPIILYADHPDFQQTTAIDGEISVGTGGVTEGLKNRVVMPFMETNQTTRHVIGHELVHAFQYHSLLDNDTTSFSEINNLPLWMIEGMAEYLSLGKKDAYTAMWMRDAYLNKDIPSIKDLTETNKYFPYRYGEAFWSYIGSTYGDTIIVPFFKNVARFGLDYGIRKTFGYDEKTLSRLWKSSIQSMYKPYLKDTTQTPVGKKLIDFHNSGEMNVAPAISPDGKYLTFLSEKNLFTIDLYLADAHTGKVIKKLTSKVSNTHIDEFNFIESAGAWSPDSKRFAFSVFGGGRNKLIIVDVASGRILNELSMGKAEQFSYVSWSPNGQDIVFSGMSNGESDLYSYNLVSKKLTQLTNDKYSDYQPSFSHDGSKIVFASDRTTYDKSLSQTITFNLAVMDVATGKVTDIDVFNGANNLNPQFSSDDKQIYFLSNRDGFRNLYRYTLADGKVEQLTDLFTGISGITEYAPALSISNNNDIAYSYYRAQKYALYNAKATDFKPVTVGPQQLNFDAAMLPPLKAVGVDLINSNLNNYLAYQKIPTDSIKTIKYRPQFKLDYLASSGVGVGVNTQYGAGLASGVQGIFSDILGRNQLYVGAAINGEIYDFGGQFAYINQSHRWDFGVSVSHIPYQFGIGTTTIEHQTISGKNVPLLSYNTDIIRNFQDGTNVFTSYPISKITRIEFGAGISYNYFRVDRYNDLYTIDTVAGNLQPGQYVGSDKKKVSNDDESTLTNYNLRAYALYSFNVGLVGDNSFFGIAAPLEGFRYRIGANFNFGTYQFISPTIDLRKYFRLQPVTLAARLSGYGRFAANSATNGLYPLFLGYPYLIRGYESQSFYNSTKTSTNGYSIDQLFGNRIALFNLEARLPFTGPEKLAVIKSKLLFTDLNVFFDAGLAWSAGDKVTYGLDPQYLRTEQTGVDPTTGKPVTTRIYSHVPSTSVGISLRINVFGALILEPYLAIPFQRTDVTYPVFGLNFAPGW